MNFENFALEKGILRLKKMIDFNIIKCLNDNMSANSNKSENKKISLDFTNQEQITDLAEVFKNFADPTRVKILCLLLNQEFNVTELAEKLNMTQPAVSQQLRLLKMNALIKFHREGKSLIYSLADDHVKEILNIGIEHLAELKS